MPPVSAGAAAGPSEKCDSKRPGAQAAHVAVAKPLPGAASVLVRLKFATGKVCVSRMIMYAAAMTEKAEPGGLRERKKLATRQALGSAAMQLAVERGLENVLVEDIAAAADVSPRTFNNYFASKYEAIARWPWTGPRRSARRCARGPRARACGRRCAARCWTSTRWPAPRRTARLIAGIRLVTSSPELRGEYLKALAVMQYDLAGVITERTGGCPAADTFPPGRWRGRHRGDPGGHRAVAVRRPAGRAGPGHRGGAARAGGRAARRAAARFRAAASPLRARRPARKSASRRRVPPVSVADRPRTRPRPPLQQKDAARCSSGSCGRTCARYRAAIYLALVRVGCSSCSRWPRCTCPR